MSNGHLRRMWASIVILTVLTSTYGQQPQTVHGRIQVANPDVDLGSVHIVNLRSGQGTVTEEDGRFFIPAAVGDSLVFSSIQLLPLTLMVEQLHPEANPLIVPLELRVTELREVVLWPYDLSGGLAGDAARLDLKDEVNAVSLGLPNAGTPIPTPAERRLMEADAGPMFYFPGVNLHKILNRLSGRSKLMRRRVDWEREEERRDAIAEQVTDSILFAELGIPASRIPEFADFCEVDPEHRRLLALNDPLLLWEFYLRKAGEYRNNYGLESPVKRSED